MKWLRTLKKVVWVLAIAGILGSGCGRGDRESTVGKEVFIFARGADASKLDPADVDDGESVNSMTPVFEGLLGYAEDSLEVVPKLAKAYEISDDGLRYTFYLREGVVFHDGVPLTAETARFSFDRQMDENHPAHFSSSSFQYWKNLYRSIERIETVDEMTLRFYLSEPDAGLIYAFASFPAWLISPGAFEAFGEGMVNHPVGTGPYRFVEWREQEAIFYEKNFEYWGDPAGFERLVIRSVPQNATRMAELLSGKVDGIDGLQPAELSGLEADERFLVYREPGLNIGYLAISDFSEKLRSRDVRRALALAIDRKSLVEIGLDGYGTVAKYPLPKEFLGIPSEGESNEYDPEKARLILEQYPELLEVELELATFSQPRVYFPDPQRMASLIKNDLEGVGLRIRIVNRDFKSHLHTTRNGDFDLALLGWIADTPDPDNFLSTFFHSKAAVKGAATNISFYRNEEMDRLLDLGLSKVDPDERSEIYESALRLWARDLPLIPLVQGDSITVLKREVEGYHLHPVGNHFWGPIYWASGLEVGAESK